METSFNFWSPLLALLVSGLLFAGYYHPKRYYVFVFLPLSLMSFLTTLGMVCYGFGAYRAMISLAPYLDPTKLEEIKRVIGPNLSPLSDSTTVSLGIVSVAALVASFLQTIGIVAANRGEDYRKEHPNEKDKT